AGVNEIPLRLIELMPLAPVELDALGNHLLAFLAHLLALARSEAVKKILKIAITPVVPVELTTDALQPASPAAQQGIGVRLGEVEVQPRLAPFSQIGRKQIKQLHGRFAVAQQPSARYRREWHCAKQLGVIEDACTMAGIGPSPVENVLAIGMALAIQRQRRLRGTGGIDQNLVLRLPARRAADASAVFKAGKESMAQKRLRNGQQGVPLVRGDLG